MVLNTTYEEFLIESIKILNIRVIAIFTINIFRLS